MDEAGRESWLKKKGIETSEDLVRALKGSSAAVDKVKVASEAWTDKDFAVARKEQLLLDWAFDVLSGEAKALKVAEAGATAGSGKNGKGKDRGKESYLTLRVDFWSLLRAVASSADEALLASASARTHPMQAISYIIDLIASTKAEIDCVTLLREASISLADIIARQRSGQVSLEACQDIILSTCKIIAMDRETILLASESIDRASEAHEREEVRAQAMTRLLLPLMDVWISLLERGANAKKSQRFFLDKMLESYARALYLLDSRASSATHAALRNVFSQLSGASLFRGAQLPQVDQIDALKRYTEEIFSTIHQAVDKVAAVHLLPVLLNHFRKRISQLAKAASAAAPSTSRSAFTPPSRHITEQMTRRAIFHAFLAPASNLLRQMEAHHQVQSRELREECLRIRLQLLKFVENRQLYVSTDEFADELFGFFKDSVDTARTGLSVDDLNERSMEVLLLVRKLDENAAEIADSDVATKIATMNFITSDSSQAEVTKDTLALMCSKATRSREVPNFVETLLGALQAAIKGKQISTIQAMQSCVFSSWFLEGQLLPALTQFVVPEQTAPLIETLRAALLPHVQTITQAATSKGESDRKRRKTSSSKKKQAETSNNGLEGDDEARQALVLLNLAAEVIKSIALAEPVLKQASDAARRLHDGIVLPLVDVGIDDASSPTSGPLAAAALELRASMATRRWNNKEESGTDGEHGAVITSETYDWLDSSLDVRFDALTDLLANDLTDVEFRIMVHNTLLQRIDRDSRTGKTDSRYAQLLTRDTFGLVTHRLPRQVAIDAPVFAVHGASKDAEVPLMWTYVAWRWLPLFDQAASVALLEGMSGVALDILGREHPPESLLDVVSRSLTQNGSNLELCRWRDALLSALDRQSEKNETRKAAECASVYHILLKLPLAYLPLPVRTRFATTAILIDRDLRLTKGLTDSEVSNRTALRQWFSAFLAYPSSELKDIDVKLDDLLSFATANDELGASFREASLHLFDVTVKSLVSAIRRKEKSSERIVLLTSVVDETRKIAREGEAHQMALRAALDLAETNVEAAGSITTSIEEEQKRWKLSEVGESDLHLATQQIRSLSSAIRAQRIARKLQGHDLDGELEYLVDESVEQLRSLLKGAESNFLDAIANDICIELLHLVKETRDPKALNKVASVFPDYLEVALSSEKALDTYAASSLMVELSSTASAQTYEETLAYLIPSLASESKEDVGRNRGLLQSCALLLCNGPEGTLATAQRHFGTFVSAMTCITAAAMRKGEFKVVHEAIQSIEAIVAGRVLLLRFQDVADILVTMSCVCSPSFGTFTEETPQAKQVSGPAIAKSIISTLSTIVRLRQELVSPLVAQLTTLLVQIMGLFKSLRAPAASLSRGGGVSFQSQTRAAQQQVPSWLKVDTEPLGVEEARLFARLLTTTTTKSTTVSSLSLASRQQKSGDKHVTNNLKKTLSRAFSNHAAYVVIAYVRVLVGSGDSATTISTEVRAELMLGLMSLCEVVGEHQRDAAMVLLEQGERILFKNVWNEWEKKRYKGV